MPHEHIYPPTHTCMHTKNGPNKLWSTIVHITSIISMLRRLRHEDLESHSESLSQNRKTEHSPRKVKASFLTKARNMAITACY